MLILSNWPSAFVNMEQNALLNHLQILAGKAKNHCHDSIASFLRRVSEGDVGQEHICPEGSLVQVFAKLLSVTSVV